MSDSLHISRQLSLCTVMETIVHQAPISRASIASHTGLSKQTVSEIVKLLENEGWIHKTGRTSGHVGRTALTYEIVPNAACIISVDLGGTKIKVAITSLACQILADITEPTDCRGGFHIIDQIARMSKHLAEKNRIKPEKIKLAVIGAPGAPDTKTGRIYMAPNIADLNTFNVAKALKDAMGITVILENDVNLAVIGENWVGNGEGIDNLAFISLGTGIGAGIMVSGKVLRGHANMAGEIGFLPMGADPFDSESLRAGAFERVTGTTGIRSYYKKLSGIDSDVPSIFQAAKDNDHNALATLDETARYLARGGAAICAITSPEKIIFGGSIGARPELIERIKKVFPLCFPYPVEVETSSLGSMAVIAGGAAVGLNALYIELFSGGVTGASISLPPAELVSFPKDSI